jgi:hypothetical protein
VRDRAVWTLAGCEIASRGKTHFTWGFNPIAHGGPLAKIFFFRFYRNRVSISPSRLIEEGRTRGRHETRGGDAVGGSMSQRVPNDRADERLDAHGQGVWSWRPGAGVTLATMLGHRADNGGKKAGPRGEHAAAVKPFAQGRPGILG